MNLLVQQPSPAQVSIDFTTPRRTSTFTVCALEAMALIETDGQHRTSQWVGSFQFANCECHYQNIPEPSSRHNFQNSNFAKKKQKFEFQIIQPNPPIDGWNSVVKTVSAWKIPQTSIVEFSEFPGTSWERWSVLFSDFSENWVCLKIVYPYTQWLMIIIPTKWL